MNTPHETLVRFDYPKSEVTGYEHWSVLVRREQVTAGSLVLCAKSDATRFGSLPSAAYGELGRPCADIESALMAAIGFEKINYLMLMMVDPQVHFHVIPRYAGSKTVCGLRFEDTGWPRAPALGDSTSLNDEQLDSMVRFLRDHWPTA